MTRVKTDRKLEIAIAVLVLALIWVAGATLEQRVVSVGDKAPGFSILASNGQPIGPSNFEGRLLMVNFWASWCPPCVEETPALKRLHEQFGAKGLTMVGISVDEDETAYKQFLDRFGIEYLTARDAQADIATSYGTFKYPETYLIDREGRVVEKIIGADWSMEELSKRIEDLLG